MVRWSHLLLALAVGILAMEPFQEVAAFAVAPPLHQKITIEALSDGNFTYVLPNGAPVEFETSALSWISVSNADIDILSLTDERFAEDFHFDDERFAIGQDILVKTRNLIVLQLTDEAFNKSSPADLLRQAELTLSSRELLGNALHTLQDYYSHSNWVEQQLLLPGNLKLNTNLGTNGKKLDAPTNASCSDGAPGVAPHTSGDYLASGVVDCEHICNARAGKCAHGNVLTTLQLPFVCPWNWALVEPDCGINKDRGFRENHLQAFDLAKQHTSIFVAEIFDEALSADPQVKNRASFAICQFMGVPDPISTCATTHTVTVQKLNKDDGQPTLGGLVQSSGSNIKSAIDCGFLCEGKAIADTTVVLTAKDLDGWKFVRWAEGGVCAASTDRECSFMVDSNKTAKAEFAQVEFEFEVAESPTPWSLLNPRLSCYHYQGEYLITGYHASFDRCYSNMSAVIRCVGSACSSSRFKVAISKSILSGTVENGGAACDTRQDPFGADPGSAQNYVEGSGWWFSLGQGWTKAWPSVSAISPLSNGAFIMQNFHWLGEDPGAPCRGSTTSMLELEFNVYDVTTGTYTLIPFVMSVP